jgi:hypothetical protein
MIGIRPPQAFLALRDEIRKRLGHEIRRERNRLRLLPLSFRALAEDFEDSRTLRELAAETKLPAWSLSRLLRRSGFYHGAVENLSARKLWADLRPHLARRRVRTTILLLLDGCRFPQDRFAVPRGVVQRFTPAQIQALGPAPAIASAFFPREQLDPAWFYQQWFLCLNHVRNEGPTRITLSLRHDFSGEYWLPLLSIALYDVTGFCVPIIVEAQRGWSLRFIQSGEPLIDADSDGNEIPASPYSVRDADLARWRSFLQFSRSASRALATSQLAEIVSRRYLRALLISGPFPDVADSSDAEDALLQLIFGLEKLLLVKGERDAIADKLALRAALLIGLDNDETRAHLYATVKRLYDMRSAIVHTGKRGGESRDAPSAWKVRGLVRDLVVAFLAVRRHVGSDDKWSDLLRRLPFSRRDQRLVTRLVQRPLRSVRPAQ